MLNRTAARCIAATGAAVLAVSLGVATPAQAGVPVPPPTGTAPVLVTDDVLTPLHLAAGSSGHSIYVADAGPGAVLRVDLDREKARVTTVADELGFVPGVTVKGRRLHVVRSAEGGGPEEQGPTYLSRISSSGKVRNLADLLALERRTNPDRQTPGGDAESNPYDLLAYKGGFIVADAGANALFKVKADGRGSVLTAFPLIKTGPCATQANQGQVGCDAVPTGIALGADGYLYVSGLGSFVAGQIWKVDPRTGAIVANLPAPPGGAPLTDIAVSDDGTVYVTSIVAGKVFRLTGDTWTAAAVPAAAGVLLFRGTLYVGSAPAALAGGEGGGEPTGPPPAGAIYAVPQRAFR